MMIFGPVHIPVDETQLAEKSPNLPAYYSSSLYILGIYALRVTRISPQVAIHMICCVSRAKIHFEGRKIDES